MTVDESKIKDVLRNRSDFRLKIEDEIHNYDHMKYNP
jgi:succinylglutamate desuccinylase